MKRFLSHVCYSLLSVTSVHSKSKLFSETDVSCPPVEPLRRVEPIYADGLKEAYKSKSADESRLFLDEFQVILL